MIHGRLRTFNRIFTPHEFIFLSIRKIFYLAFVVACPRTCEISTRGMTVAVVYEIKLNINEANREKNWGKLQQTTFCPSFLLRKKNFHCFSFFFFYCPPRKFPFFSRRRTNCLRFFCLCSHTIWRISIPCCRRRGVREREVFASDGWGEGWARKSYQGQEGTGRKHDVV